MRKAIRRLKRVRRARVIRNNEHNITLNAFKNVSQPNSNNLYMSVTGQTFSTVQLKKTVEETYNPRRMR